MNNANQIQKRVLRGKKQLTISFSIKCHSDNLASFEEEAKIQIKSHHQEKPLDNTIFGSNTIFEKVSTSKKAKVHQMNINHACSRIAKVGECMNGSALGLHEEAPANRILLL